MSQMVGVVLWADQMDQKAVIWCEDHGELAYWHDPEPSVHGGDVLEVGDLVQFDMAGSDSLRLAMNPQRLESNQFFGLVQSLHAAGDAAELARGLRPAESRVISFPGTPPRERNVA
ncbi:hypothetical protein [Salipiger mangrovisoli]|uniref:Uncharacterized protein n=1 Tax=Salipiger mangrovisoli TaxID=2865933 RepID=A0ABR9X3I6_9RHOB|nr:hypothetical protein [Salipiger mangrovisoli]MBE9638134.1 hypothetical protein [Salipiger mangrovisoli]